LKAVKNPIPAAAAVLGLIALGGFAKPVQAQDQGRVAETAALSGPGLQDNSPAVATKTPVKKPKQAAAHKSGKPHPKSDVGGLTFESRTGHYFDPLSLAPAPDSRPDPIKSQFDQVTSSTALPDRAPVATTPDDSANSQISSATIEQMGKGRNSTVVVPLFHVLNGLSTGPAE